jgi:hypothetical protein
VTLVRGRHPRGGRGRCRAPDARQLRPPRSSRRIPPPRRRVGVPVPAHLRVRRPPRTGAGVPTWGRRQRAAARAQPGGVTRRLPNTESSCCVSAPLRPVLAFEVALAGARMGDCPERSSVPILPRA